MYNNTHLDVRFLDVRLTTYYTMVSLLRHVRLEVTTPSCVFSHPFV